MKIKSYVLSGVLLGISHIMYAGDIQNDIYNLNNRNNASNEIFYSNNMGTTYTGWAWGKDFTQTYENGTLIIGNISKDPNANNMHWFGRGGDIGFINATFNAKEVYITGTLGSGNSLRTGGGANLTFNANSNLTLDNAYIHINRAGTQNSTTSLNGQTINIKNSEFNIENINGGGINIGSANTNNIILDNTHIKMDGGQINVIAKNSKLNFGAINIVNGTLDLTQANYTELTTHSINMTNSSFRSNELNMLGDIVNGRFVPTQTPAYGADPLQNLGNSGQDFTADSVVIDDNNSTLKAVNATIGELSFKGAALSGATKKLTATISGKLNITTLTNPYHWAGVGFTSELDVKEASEVNIGTINHQNYTSGSTIRVNTENKLVVENISFSTDGISGSNGRVELNSSNGDVVVRNVVGCNGSCTGGLGIRPLNILKISGKNFYGGNIEAIGLTTAGSNSTLDLTGVMGTKFIDIFSIRSGTLKASDFHINNFVVYKGNSYSVVDQNIGKSFINYLSMELGTSDTADGADIRFTGGGEILNFNVIDARPTSFIHMSGDKAKKINYVNTNIMNIKEAEVNLHNGIFNTIVSQKGQTAIASNTKIVANALNVNELLHIKDSSKHS
ncbi:autotransporter domain-containing protein, partial [Helicobacter trogontum]